MSGPRKWITVAELRDTATRARVWKRLSLAGAILTAAAFYAAGHEAEIIQVLKADQADKASIIQSLTLQNANMAMDLMDKRETIKQERREIKILADALRFCADPMARP